MVLLGGVTLLSVAVAAGAAWLEPAAVASRSAPVFASSAAPPSSGDKQSVVEKQSVRLVDQAPVRVIGAPFVPNTNPRER